MIPFRLSIQQQLQPRLRRHELFHSAAMGLTLNGVALMFTRPCLIVIRFIKDGD